MRRATSTNAHLYYGGLLVLGLAAASIASVALLTLGSAQKVDAVASSLPAKTYEIARNGTFGGEPNNEESATVACDAGDRRLSGGYLGADVGTHVIVNAPSPTTGEKWFVQWRNDATVDELFVVVSCSDLRPGQPPR